MSYVEYNSNNSGGSWWLEDKDWKALEKAGWVVEWKNLEHAFTEKGDYVRLKNGLPKLVPLGKGNGKHASIFRNKPGEDGKVRWLGALATKAYKPGAKSIREAADEWERITGQTATDAGCPCCGQPHTFTLYDDNGKYVESGPSARYEASW